MTELGGVEGCKSPGFGSVNDRLTSQPTYRLVILTCEVRHTIFSTSNLEIFGVLSTPPPAGSSTCTCSVNKKTQKCLLADFSQF